MDSRARGLHLTWLSSVARPANWFCDWHMDQWISPPFPDACAGSPWMWPRMLRAGLHRGGRDFSGPTGAGAAHLVARDGDKWGGRSHRGPHISHPISLSQHGSSRCRSGPRPFTQTHVNWQTSVKSLTYLDLGTLPGCTNVESLHFVSDVTEISDLSNSCCSPAEEM